MENQRKLVRFCRVPSWVMMCMIKLGGTKGMLTSFHVALTLDSNVIQFPMTKVVFPRFASLIFLVIMIVHILSLAVYLIIIFPSLQILLASGILPLQLNQFNAPMLQKPGSIWSSRSGVTDDLMESPRGHIQCLMKFGLLNT